MSKKALVQPFGMILIAFAFVWLLSLGEEYVIKTRVEPVGMKLNDWLNDFRFWGRVGIASSLVAGLLWYWLAQRKFRIDRLKNRDRRWFWVSLFILPLVATGVAVYFTKPVQEGAWVANAAYGISALASYYFETAMFSPLAFKYTPVGAERLRFWEAVLTIRLRRNK